MELTLKQLEEKTQMNRRELFEFGVPRSCQKGHECLRYAPTGGKELMYDCDACNENDVAFTKAALRMNS